MTASPGTPADVAFGMLFIVLIFLALASAPIILIRLLRKTRNRGNR